jgi:TRAP-type C4-dicarboxylate transport system substrate-binding protein
VGQSLLDKLPEKGLVGLTYWDLGFREVTNSKRPIAKVLLDPFEVIGADLPM